MTSNLKAISFRRPQGFVHPAFEHVLDVFRDGFASGKDKGASFAAYYKGKLIVSIWGGFADEKAKRPWKEETMGHFHSCTKFVTAVCVADLVERGLLNYEEKVSQYWPEFSQNGKHDITLSTLLSHKAGLAALSETYDLKMMRENPHELRALLAKQKPLWEPGKHHGYSPLIIGLYLNEIVSRVDPKGRSVSQYFHEEFARPFGIEFYIGLPEHLQYRAARLEPQGNVHERAAQSMANFQGDYDVFLLASSQPRDWNSRWKLNDPDFQSLPCPSSHGVGTAKAAAKLAGIIANGGKFEEKTLLSPKSIELLQQPIASGVDLTYSDQSTFGRGTMLNTARAGKQIWTMFGHSGYGGQNLVADTKFKLGWAYVTNYVEPFSDFQSKRWKPLVDALYQCILKLEGIPGQFEMFESAEEQLTNTITTSKL